MTKELIELAAEQLYPLDEHTDLADLDADRRYDAAITMHVQMNVDDKQAWFTSIADHLADGAGSRYGRSAPSTTPMSPGRCRGPSTEPTAT